ncbi:hypothetical protein DRJ25_03285 [Candidatus Woesearchaeota archaeon]|nr:MAG: hypothetical protein DRJ25_03285 [Candidatus Woesearchaeota archaeon]
MRGFTTIDLYFMTKELQTLLNSRIDKIYQLKEDIYLSIYVPSKGSKLLRITPNKLWLTKHKPEFEELPHMAKTLRRFLQNARIKEIIQIKSERILQMTIEKEQEFKLYLEFFSNGNTILEKDSKIVAARIEKKWKDRSLLRGQPYQYPPESEDVFNLEEEQLKEKLKDEIASKALAKIGFGKDYAEEICKRANIDHLQTNADAKKILEAIKDIMNSEIRPQVYYDNEQPVLATPIPMIHIRSKSITTQTFSAALDLVENKPIRKDRTQKEKEKIENIIRLQEESMKKLEKKAAAERRKAELIYEKYTEIKDTLEKIKNKEQPKNVKVDWEKKKARIKIETEQE